MSDTTTAVAAPGAAESPLPMRPELLDAMLTMLGAMKANRRLPDRLVELMRLRVAFRNQCRACMSMRYGDAIDDGLTEDMVCSLEQPEGASDMNDAEKAAVAYADRFAVDHLAIDRQLAALSDHFDAGEIAEIAVNVACFVGFGRLAAVFDDGAALPVGDRSPNGDLLAPWRVSAPMVMR